MHKTIGKKITTYVQGDLESKAEVEKAWARLGRNTVIFWGLCLAGFIAVAMTRIVTGTEDVVFYFVYLAIFATVGGGFLHRGWSEWRGHKRMRDVYKTLAQDPDILVITGSRITRVKPDEEARKAESESDSVDHDDARSHDRESDGGSARRAIPEVSTDDHRR